ncbi:SdrD B-like domain-containing protein, partial [Paracoccaceae bacterium GXU_MW_L88]
MTYYYGYNSYYGYKYNDYYRSYDHGSSYDYGNASLSGRYFYDKDNSDTESYGDKGVACVVVKLIDSDGKVVATTTTDYNGNYKFTNLKAGDYRVVFPKQDGKVFADQNVGSNKSVDSDADANGISEVVSVGKGECWTNVDAGIQTAPRQESAIKGRFFADNDNSNTENDGDTGLAGKTVTLVDANGNVVATTTTDAHGNYAFTGLAAGQYRVVFPDLDGKTFAAKDVGYSSTDSDANANGQTDIIKLGDCQTVKNVDAGVQEENTASITGRFFHDNDNSDTESRGDTGVEGATITLVDADGNVVATTTTDANGKYSFKNLAEGQYRVLFPEQDDKTFADKDVGDKRYDSDADASGQTDLFTVGAGKAICNVDAGIQEGGTVVAECVKIEAEDMNLCGFRVGTASSTSGGEYVYDATSGWAYATTTWDGAAGTFDITLGAWDASGGKATFYIYVNGKDVSGPIYTDRDTKIVEEFIVEGIDLKPGDQIKVWAAGDYCDKGYFDYLKICNTDPVVELGSIGDTVFYDLNGDGIQNAGETGVAGAEVNLRDADGNVIATTTTDENGNYIFDGLEEGEYSVSVVAPEGYVFTGQDQGGNDDLDSDVDADGNTGTISLGAGEDITNVDAGLIVEDPHTASLGDTVWYDTNGDGVLNGSESGAAGVSVELLVDGEVVATTLTDANGKYLFDGLAAGDYQVRFTTPDGYEFTEASTVAADAVNSDSDANV